MSMDEVDRELKRFLRDLEHFNATLRSSTSSLAKEHQKVSGMWNDEFAKTYQRRWQTFARDMERYQKGEAGKYESFIKGKIRQVGQYLRG